MPPSGARRPEPAVLTGLLASFESRMDRHAALNPNPGSRPFQRLNRAEYANAVRDLLSVDVDVSTYLPPDTISHGFDNVADAQTLLADVDGRLPARGQPDQPSRGGRSQRLGHVDDLQDSARRVADAPRRRRADGHARRPLGGAHLPGRRPLPPEGVAALRAARRPGRPQHHDRLRPEGTGRVLGERRARGDVRSQHAHERDRSQERPRAGDAAGAHQGRPAARDRGVRPEARRPGRRPADAAREHARRRQHHLGRHDAAAPARLHRAGADGRHRRVGHAEPPEDLLVPSHREGGGRSVRGRDRQEA